MTWRWTLEDQAQFQRLRRALAVVLEANARGFASKALHDELRKAYHAAFKAAIPTHDPDHVALLRQWLAMVASYLESEAETQRIHLGALSILQAGVADILGPSPDAIIERAVRGSEDVVENRARSPYWND